MIPAKAIEAAHKAWRAQAALDGTIFEYNLRAALEAAAPHMLAEAWDEGHHYGTRGQVRYQEDSDTNPYRPTP